MPWLVEYLATKAGGVPEIIQDEINGFLAPIKDAAKLAERVNYVLSNAEIRQAIIKKGKATAEQFSKNQMAEKTYLAYKKVLGD